MKSLFVTLIVASVACAAAVLQAESIDCGKAKSRVEKIICADNNLVSADYELAYLYKVLKSVSPNIQEIKSGQLAWITNRDKCKDYPCVASRYEKRTKEISAALRRLPALRDESLVSDEYSMEEELQASPQETPLGKMKCHVRVEGSPTVSFVSITIEFPDDSQVLSVETVALKDKAGTLHFDFVDGWNNWGKGSFRSDGSVGKLNLDAYKPSDEPTSHNVLRMYGEYSLPKVRK